MPLDRRSFLASLPGAALILGLGELVQEGKATTKAWKRALELMKERKWWGVALVVPEDEAGRKALAEGLERWINTFDSRLRQRLVEAIYVCVPAGVVEAKAGENAVLVKPDGTRAVGATLDLRDEASSATGLRKLLHDDGRLAERAALVRDAAFESALMEFSSDDQERLARGRTRLDDHAERWAPALVALLADAPGDRRPLIEGILNLRFHQLMMREEDPGIPLGVSWKLEPLPTGKPDACPTCGMAVAGPRTRKFLKFLLD